MDEQLLIDKVREYNLLYDTNCLSYRDQNRRHEAWKAIGKEMKLSVTKRRCQLWLPKLHYTYYRNLIVGMKCLNLHNFCLIGCYGVGDGRHFSTLVKETWTKLRNCYINALKRRRSKKNGQAKKIMAWKYEQQMSFLQPFLYNRNTQTNLEESSQDSLTFEENTSYVGNEDDEPERNRPSDVESVSEPEVKLWLSSKKRHQLSPADEMVHIKRTNPEYYRSKFEINQTKYNEIDESDMFYMSMSKQAKRLPALDQAKIKLELCNLIQQAEIRQLENQAIPCKHSNSFDP